MEINHELRVNEQVRARRVRLIDKDGNQLGIVPLSQAIDAAYEQSLDLVEVAASADPPVCRIMDYGKYKYEQAKSRREARKRQKTVQVKEVKMRPNIEDHDFMVKTRNARRFLDGGDKVKATIMFRGREIVHSNLGRELLKRMREELKELAVIERMPTLEGHNMVMVLSPKRNQEG